MLLGAICHSMGAQEFGLTEASYATARILQSFPKIQAGGFERPQAQDWLAYSSHHSQGLKRTATERQKMTIVMSSGDGCPLRLWRSGE